MRKKERQTDRQRKIEMDLQLGIFRIKHDFTENIRRNCVSLIVWLGRCCDRILYLEFGLKEIG